MNKLLLIIIATVLVITSCNNEVKNFCQKLDKQYETLPEGSLSKVDTSIVIREYNGDFNSYKKFLVEHRKNFVKNYQWSRAAKHILLDVDATKKLGNKLGFENPYYFLKYLKCDSIKSRQKDSIIKAIRNRLIEKTKQPDFVKSLSANNLLRASFQYRMKGNSCTNNSGNLKGNCKHK